MLTNPDRDISEKPIFLVDSSSWYSIVPLVLARKLKLKPVMKTKLTLADKLKLDVQLSPAYISIMSREVATLVALMNVPEPLLGVETMEALGLKLNPVRRKLEVTRPYTTLLV